jgi:hypothetical protein
MRLLLEKHKRSVFRPGQMVDEDPKTSLSYVPVNETDTRRTCMPSSSTCRALWGILLTPDLPFLLAITLTPK